jgi:hypothetical protein
MTDREMALQICRRAESLSTNGARYWFANLLADFEVRHDRGAFLVDFMNFSLMSM